MQTGKFEIAIDPFGKFMLCDAITSDELELGGFDKNPLRDWYRLHHPDWVVALEVAKKQFPGDKSRWPSYPCEPPAALVEKMIGVYAHVAQTLG